MRLEGEPPQPRSPHEFAVAVGAVPVWGHAYALRATGLARTLGRAPDLSAHLAVPPDPDTVVVDAWLSVQPGLGPAQRVANLHGYLLPRERAGVLWGLGLHDPFAEPTLPDPQGDLVLHAAWTGFETLLVQRQPMISQFLTPGSNRDYPAAAWTAFLRDHGYAPDPAGGWRKCRPG